MALDSKTVQKPFRRLRKILKKFPDPPGPEDVHDVRTHTRKIEALVGALQLDDRKSGSNLVKSLKPIRKAAGDVRDMDVLTDFAASLNPGSDGDCRLRLMEHLAVRRTKAAAKLSKKVNANAHEARDLLKRSGNRANDGLDASDARNSNQRDKQKSREKSADTMASALQIEQELRDWPKLTEKNIHPFRLKVKELRYVLQAGENADSKLVDTLRDVKDRIGLWHDWNELSTIASKVLDHGSKCPIRAQIRERTKQGLEKALQAANALRTQYLQTDSGRRQGRKRPVAELHPAAIKATSRLAS